MPTDWQWSSREHIRVATEQPLQKESVQPSIHRAGDSHKLNTAQNRVWGLDAPSLYTSWEISSEVSFHRAHSITSKFEGV